MESLMEKLTTTLREKKYSLCVAESCTGGLLSSEITKLSGVSDVYMGGFITYSNRMKREILNVPAELLSTLGAVSRPVALHMARGAKNLTKTTWAVSITGIAGPTGGTDTKPVGTVCFAIVGPGFEWTTQVEFSGSRTQVQQSSAEFAARSLLEII
ncbi:MAG: CinA family protein [Bdellovibrionales bacterium]|nr:CinA family protein [Bdellovibrionales bacterium]